jgi:L-asparagine oxygenase
MTVELDRSTGEQVGQLSLDGDERRELDMLASLLSDMSPARIDEPQWADAALETSAQLPRRVREAMRRLRRDSGDEGVFLVRGLPVSDDEIGPTPNVRGSVQRTPTKSSSATAMIALQLGELFAFNEEKSGALVQDVVPVPGMEEFQGNAGSVQLTMHNENAFHPNRPDFVGLMCLRNDHDNIAGLQIASSRLALRLLPEPVRDILRQPRYVTAAPGSFDLDDRMFEPEGVLQGSPEDPDVRIDFTSTQPLDDEARAAMATFGEALAVVRRTFILQPGDFAIVDNRRSLHGRTAFRARYDGRDRWLQRVFVTLDFRR